MSNNVKCKDCSHATWERTPTGRIKAKHVGRCNAVLPPTPVTLYSRAAEPPKFNAKWDRRPAIWLDYEGRCDLYAALAALRPYQGGESNG